MRISIRGGYFSGPPELDAHCTQMSAVIVHASGVHRSYFAGEYQPEGNQLPACWSTDTERPALQVPAATRQSGRCIDCSQNIRGSAIGGNGIICYSRYDYTRSLDSGFYTTHWDLDSTYRYRRHTAYH